MREEPTAPREVVSPTFHQPATPAFAIVWRYSPTNRVTPYIVTRRNFSDGGGDHGGFYTDDKDKSLRRFAERVAEAFQQTIECGGWIESTASAKENQTKK